MSALSWSMQLNVTSFSFNTGSKTEEKSPLECMFLVITTTNMRDSLSTSISSPLSWYNNMNLHLNIIVNRINLEPVLLFRNIHNSKSVAVQIRFFDHRGEELELDGCLSCKVNRYKVPLRQVSRFSCISLVCYYYWANIYLSFVTSCSLSKWLFCCLTF